MLDLLPNSVCLYPIQTIRTSLLDHLANNHIFIFLLCSSYVTEDISSISLQHHYESKKLRITLCLAYSGSWTSPSRGVKIAVGVTHTSQRGQQAAANVYHGKCMPAIKGVQLQLQIKHSKILSGVKKKCMGDLFARPYHTKFYLYSYALDKLQVLQQDSKKRENFAANFFSIRMISCHVSVPRSALQERVWLCTTIQKGRHADNTAPGHAWSLASARESKRLSTAKLLSSEKFYQLQPDKN